MNEESVNATGIAESGAAATEAAPAASAEPASASVTESAQETAAPAAAGADESLFGKASTEAAASEAEPSEESEPAEPVVEGAPEKYEDFTAPEGTKLDAETCDAFKEAAKDLNLSQKKAQDLIDKVAPVIAKREREQYMAINSQWVERSTKNKEISAGMADIARLRDMFGRGADGKVDPDIDEIIHSPMGNHPGLLKLLARAGKAFGEAGYPTGKPVARRLTADDVYGNFSER